MGFISNEIDRSILRQGDHIYRYKTGHIFNHHGIYVGNNRVIHFTKTRVMNTCTSQSNESCENCGYQPNSERGVVQSCLDCFLQGHRLFRFEYNVSSRHFLAKKSRTCSTQPHDAPNVVVQRATQMLTMNDRKSVNYYDVFENNCEAFSVYCMTGNLNNGQCSTKAKAKMAFKQVSGVEFSLENFDASLLVAGVLGRSDTNGSSRVPEQPNEDLSVSEPAEEGNEGEDEAV